MFPQKTLISKESAVKQFMCEFKKNQDTFDLSTQEGLHGFLARFVLIIVYYYCNYLTTNCNRFYVFRRQQLIRYT